MKLFNKDVIKSESRRKFLSIVSIGTLSFIGTTSFFSNPKKLTDQEELILVNGWVLKKKDLDVI